MTSPSDPLNPPDESAGAPPFRPELPDWIDAFARHCTEPFSRHRVLDFLRRRAGLDLPWEEVAAYLSSSDYVFDPIGENDPFVPRRAFFRGARFRVRLSPWEIREQLLFPGHRFFPFISRTVFPADVRLLLPDGTESTPVFIRRSPSDLRVDLLLFGRRPHLDYLAYENHTDIRRILSMDIKEPLYVRAFDLRGFLAKNPLGPEDALLLSVVDWDLGILALEKTVPPPSRTAFTAWMNTFLAAFFEAIDYLGLGEGDAYEQLAQTCFIAAEDPVFAAPLTVDPPIPLYDAALAHPGYRLLSIESRNFFFPDEEDAPEPQFAESRRLSRVFMGIGIDLPPAALEEIVFSSIRRNEPPERCLEEIVGDAPLPFSSAADRDAFLRDWAALREKIRNQTAS